ncbi:hypothetical protein [Occallatibacter riparius]|uniref:Uncharacterized protein n=1 Tax=Occallatibacter riparius TaxID=1002689 RepID=A0A9J7BS93_9BACT|nr:hypothetical protein [Occallatibacter riparius]UWZ84634.1 hypothetical protein MOP44_01565 [Occallatibacter riparius]
MAKRERPEDGGIEWHDRLNAFECLGCGEFDEVHSARRRNDAEWMQERRELLVLDHTECWEFDDPKMARDARRYRSERKRRELLKARAGAALDRQAVSWRGR